MKASRLSAVLVSSSLLFAPVAIAAEQAPVPDTNVENDRVYPQEEVHFPTWWFTRTNWKVYNPNAEAVQVHIYCAKYSYSYWTWVPAYDEVTDAWGCEGAALEVFNNASQGSELWVDVTTW